MSHILDHGQLTRVGGAKSFPVDVRVIAATSRDLGRMVKEGAFRAELYYRLREYPVTLPPLRDRPEEIPALAARFAGECARESGAPRADPGRGDSGVLEENTPGRETCAS